MLVQQGIDDALEKSKQTTMDKGKWVAMKKKAVSTIRLAIAPEVKYNYLMETDPGMLLEKLQEVYALKSLTIKLCLRWELYQLMKEDDISMQDHINTFNQLVCQSLNADEKLSDEEKALLLLASLSKSYKNIVQTLLIRRESITLDQPWRRCGRTIGSWRDMMGKRRKGVVRHFMVMAQEGEKKRKVIKQGGSLKGGVTIVTMSVTTVRRRGTFK